MPVTATMIGAVLDAGARVFPASVVSCAHPFADSAGNAQTQTFDATEAQLTAKQQISMFGTLDSKVSTLTVNLLRYPMMVRPKAGDRLTKRKGDAAATKHVVIEPVTLTLDTVLTLTIGPDNG